MMLSMKSITVKSRKKLYEAVCSQCGAQTKVPFKPMEGKEVFCKECFAKRSEG